MEQHRLGPVLSTYNVPVNPDMTVADLETVLNDIYRTQSHAFKLNISFGVILRHVETEEVRYFRPYSNQALFDQPIFVGRRADIANIVQRLNDTDVIESVIKNRPDTKWRLEFITNARFQVFSTNFVLGTARTPLPSFIKLNDSVIGLENDRYGLPYNDHLCAFRCLSLYYHKDLKHTSEYFIQWKEYLFSECETDIRELSMKKFEGVQLSQLPYFEECFRLNVHVFDLQPLNIAVPVFKSTDRYEQTMYLNHYKNHLSYIQNFELYSKQFQCQSCKRIFDHHGNWKNHGKICENKTKYTYPGGFFQKRKTVFEELELVGIHVDTSDRYFPYFAVYDFESVLEKNVRVYS